MKITTIGMGPAVALALTACQTTKVADNAVAIGVQFAFKAGSDTCAPRGTNSPSITLTGIPAGATNMFVQMIDLDNPMGDHGFGDTLPYAGNNVIPYGALKNFRGPCPPSGSHAYQITVNALDAKGVVIGAGKGVSSTTR